MTCSVKFFDPTTMVVSERVDAELQIVAATSSTRLPTPATPRRRLLPSRASRCPSRLSRPSTASASAAAGTAPARMVVVSTIDKPRKMYSPNPPAPTAAATVAVPTPMTAAIRTPEMMAGSASGSSTRYSSCRDVMPTATPASTTAASTCCNPVAVLRTIGSKA
jgi:hypothetical protein